VRLLGGLASFGATNSFQKDNYFNHTFSTMMMDWLLLVNANSRDL
jgi:hypothetical protein